MTTPLERRGDAFINGIGEQFDATIVARALVLQRQVNSVSAIEFMKHRGIPAAIIARVLTGAALRETDKALRARHA